MDRSQHQLEAYQLETFRRARQLSEQTRDAIMTGAITVRGAPVSGWPETLDDWRDYFALQNAALSEAIAMLKGDDRAIPESGPTPSRAA